MDDQAFIFDAEVVGTIIAEDKDPRYANAWTRRDNFGTIVQAAFNLVQRGDFGHTHVRTIIGGVSVTVCIMPEVERYTQLELDLDRTNRDSTSPTGE